MGVFVYVKQGIWRIRSFPRLLFASVTELIIQMFKLIKIDRFMSESDHILEIYQLKNNIITCIIVICLIL